MLHRLFESDRGALRCVKSGESAAGEQRPGSGSDYDPCGGRQDQHAGRSRAAPPCAAPLRLLSFSRLCAEAEAAVVTQIRTAGAADRGICSVRAARPLESSKPFEVKLQVSG